MNVVGTVELFYALLAIAANVFVIVVVGLALAGRGSSSAQGWLAGMRSAVGPSALAGAFVVAVLATAGSLYFSEVAQFKPCRLCWYQRIAMYPLVVILGIAAWRGDPGVRRYAAPLAAIGAVISTYHYLLEWFPALDSGVVLRDHAVFGRLVPSARVRQPAVHGAVSIPAHPVPALARHGSRTLNEDPDDQDRTSRRAAPPPRRSPDAVDAHPRSGRARHRGAAVAAIVLTQSGSTPAPSVSPTAGPGQCDIRRW